MASNTAVETPDTSLEHCRVTVNVEKAAHNLRSPHRVDPLDIYLDKFGETFLVKIKNKIIKKIEPITNNDEQLDRKFGLFEEVSLWENTLDLPNLTCASDGLIRGSIGQK
jgi:hypothetical protein